MFEVDLFAVLTDDLTFSVPFIINAVFVEDNVPMFEGLQWCWLHFHGSSESF